MTSLSPAEEDQAVYYPNPVLNWVRDDDHAVVLTGSAVRPGKLVRLQADWHYGLGDYNGPERFTIRGARTRFRPTRKVADLIADVDGPPHTHSLQAWQAGMFGATRQCRFYFTDLHDHRSGELTVSALDFFTTAPSLEADIGMRVQIPYGPTGQLAVNGGRASTRYYVGAVIDPRLRVSLMVTSGDGSRNDLTPYLPQPRRALSPSRDDDLMFIPHDIQRPAWLPAFADGRRSMEIEVDEHTFTEVVIVPESEYVEPFADFMVGFALRVELADDPSQFILSDIVTAQGGARNRRIQRSPRFPEGAVLFRA